jgi:chromosome segregation ATPase
VKKFLPWILIGALALGVLALIDRSCGGPDPAYWVKRADYDKDVAAQAAKTTEVLAMIKEAGQVIIDKDNDLAARESKIDELEAQTADYFTELDALAKETAALKANAAMVIAANPAVRALVDNFELRLAASDRQIFTLTATIEEERAAKADWIAKYDAAILQRDAWQGEYNDEHALRLTCDSLRLDLEKHARGGKLWSYVGKGSVAYFAIKGGIKLAQSIF